MKAAHRQTLDRIFANPVSTSIKGGMSRHCWWQSVRKFRKGEARGCVSTLNGVTLRLHRPHPSPDTKSYVIREIRTFLIDSGVEL
ncbi:conserved hypothetical protein [Mesorhizobium prunaredense]|uniref:Type II toxin-antitoxin system HicA family toxin n=1 Tax=Mesorhizobium prunaredense TaxID=1631249 RepID=A0A1R3VFZ4_9HYPH|nr:conserved hypothetical protein [Mesorhizobium prunaredense]